jgi:hypothetical protein
MIKLILVPVAAAAAFILGGVQHASASESWYTDEDGDYAYDTLNLDTSGDGYSDIVGHDWNHNGIFEQIYLDSNFDGVFDAVAYDNPEDSFTDLIDVDVDQDGVFEQNVYASAAAMYTGTPGVATISSPTNPDGFYTLMMTMAAVTGQPTYGTPDSDHDGYLDSNDDYPYDPYRI